MESIDTFVWEECSPSDKYPLLAHTSVQVGIFLFLFGGNDGYRYRTDLHTFDLRRWTFVRDDPLDQLLFCSYHAIH